MLQLCLFSLCIIFHVPNLIHIQSGMVQLLSFILIYYSMMDIFGFPFFYINFWFDGQRTIACIEWSFSFTVQPQRLWAQFLFVSFLIALQVVQFLSFSMIGSSVYIQECGVACVQFHVNITFLSIRQEIRIHRSSDLDIQVLGNHPDKHMYFTLDPLGAKPNG